MMFLNARTLCLLIVFIVSGSFDSGNTLEATQLAYPNVVLIVADDLGYGELGCYGGTEIPTPNLDALARRGVRLTNGYVTAPYCAASRAALMTGVYQTRFGFEFNPIGARNEDPEIGLPTRMNTIADHLRRAGYATSLIGKWHLGGTAKYHPQRRGFDEFFGFTHEGHYFVPPPYKNHTTWLRRRALPLGGRGRWTSPDGKMIWTTHMGGNEPAYDTNNPIVRGSQPVNEGRNLTEAFTREACDFIRRHESQPFFLYLAYNAVHSPLQARDDYMAKFAHIDDIQRRIFAGMLAHMDDGIGEVIQQLEASDLTENTLIIFLSDNGGPTKELTSSNAPLRDGKGSVYEGGLRVPFIVSLPGTLPEGRVVDVPITSMDAVVTALEMCTAKPRVSFDGTNVLPQLVGDSEAHPHEAIYWRLGKRQAMRAGRWKIARDLRRSAEWELYDLDEDIAEEYNLAEEMPDEVKRLGEMWQRWSDEQSDPAW